MIVRAKQKYLTLSRADAAALAKVELREVYVPMRQNIGHRQQPLPLNGEWMLCDETAECPSEGVRIDSPYRVGEVLGVKEAWRVFGRFDDNNRWSGGYEYRADLAQGEYSNNGIGGELDFLWSVYLARRNKWCMAHSLPNWAIRHWLLVVSVEPAQIDGQWKWKVGVEKTENPKR